jgi:hypothetical protein
LQAYYYRENNHNVDNNFCTAFDEFNDINRKLFEVPEIDKLLSFSDKKNICIQNQSHQSSNFLNCVIAKICIDYHSCKTSDKDNKVEKKRTILIDAGSGNNLGCFYLNLVNQAIKKEADINSILDRIIIARAFTFSQLANILIYELPKMVKEIGNKLQIIILDLFDTLVSSNVKSRMKKFENNGYSTTSRNAIQENISIVNEMIDVLISLSVKYFVILTCDDCENIKDNSIAFKFNNTINIKHSTGKNKNKNEQIFKIEQITCQNNNSINSVNTEQLAYLDRDKIFSPARLVNLSGAW